MNSVQSRLQCSYSRIFKTFTLNTWSSFCKTVKTPIYMFDNFPNSPSLTQHFDILWSEVKDNFLFVNFPLSDIAALSILNLQHFFEYWYCQYIEDNFLLVHARNLINSSNVPNICLTLLLNVNYSVSGLHRMASILASVFSKALQVIVTYSRNSKDEQTCTYEKTILIFPT